MTGVAIGIRSGLRNTNRLTERQQELRTIRRLTAKRSWQQYVALPFRLAVTTVVNFIVYTVWLSGKVNRNTNRDQLKNRLLELQKMKFEQAHPPVKDAKWQSKWKHIVAESYDKKSEHSKSQLAIDEIKKLQAKDGKLTEIIAKKQHALKNYDAPDFIEKDELQKLKAKDDKLTEIIAKKQHALSKYYDAPEKAPEKGS
jgi:hypothetical protein